MEIKKSSLDNLKIGNKRIELEPTKIIVLKDIFKSKIKRWFSNKFCIIVILIDYQGDFKFYLSRIKEGIIKIDKVVYRINSNFIRKTNTKYNLICFNENNPEAINFSHKENKIINSNNLTEFMDMELVGMALRVKKKNSFTVTHIIIICVVLFVMVIVGLAMTGIVDVEGFFMP